MRLLIVILLLVCSASVFAQDQLFKKDNSKVEVKIIEINQSEIKYKLFNYQDGPTIIVAKSDVALIIYQNGTHEVFNVKTETTNEQPTVIVYKDDLRTKNELSNKREQERQKHFEELTTTKNLVSVNIMEPLNGTFGLNYLREFANNQLNVFVPVSVGFTSPFFNQPSNTVFNTNYSNYNISDFRYTRKTFETGIGIHFQTSGKRPVTHFIGPYFGIAQYNGTFSEHIGGSYNPYYGYYNNYTVIEHGFVMNRYYVMLNNGILFRATKNFNIILNAAIGYHTDEFVSNNPTSFSKTNNYNYYNNSFPLNSLKLGLSMGYRF